MATDLKRADRTRLLRDRLDRGGHLADGEAQLLDELAQMVARLEAAPHEFAVTSVVSRSTGEGKLDVAWHGMLAQIDPVKAREIAWMLLEAASIAEAEAMLVRFARDKIGISEGQGTALLNDLRAFRAALDNQGSLVGHDPKATN